MSEQKFIGYDLDGEEILSKVLIELIDGFAAGKKITFSSLDKNSGFTVYPILGAAILSEKTDICGTVIQRCQYPFAIVYRQSPKLESQKIRIKELLDNLGRYLEGQSVTVEGEEMKLSAYPKLTDGRNIYAIRRETSAYVEETEESGAQDWIIQMNLKYYNTFERMF